MTEHDPNDRPEQPTATGSSSAWPTFGQSSGTTPPPSDDEARLGPGPGTGPPPYGEPRGYGSGQPPSGWGPAPGSYGRPAGGGQPAGGFAGLSQNAASGLAYVLTWVTGLVFFFVDKRPEVRFHAMQSIIFGVTWSLLGFLTRLMPSPISLLLALLSFAFFVLWIVLMIQGFTGKHFKLPIAGDIAEQQAQQVR